MEKDLLYNYFECRTSAQEEQAVVDWVNESPENKELFEAERKLWLLTCLRENLIHAEREKSEQPNSLRLQKRLLPLLKIACVLLIGLFLGKWVLSDGEEKKPALQTVISPAGQQTEIVLADGSKVWLNSLSSLTYPVSFSQTERRVNLEGEAYFEVSKKKGMPFIVRAGNYNVQVLGTAFNVLSRSEKGVFETSLFTGSVKLYSDTQKDSAILLRPREKAVLEKGKLVKGELAGGNMPAWKSGLFEFDNTPFQEVVEELASFFKVTLWIDNPALCDYKYTGKLRRKDGVAYLLEVLSKDNPFEYSRDEKGDYHLK